MTYLLDVSTLLAWLWRDHEHHSRVISWQSGQDVAICPITELGFLRISSQPAFGATMKEAREILADWIKKAKPSRIACDMPALDGLSAPVSGKTTDFYLANLGAKHRLRFATLDESIAHPAVFIVPH
jgi:predicted nucleic acid-binding protein